MPQLPRDVTDLALAPVVLAIDDALKTYADLDRHDIDFRIALETDREPRSLEARAAAVLHTLVRDVDLHGWTTSWSDRGLCLQHDDRSVTLGLPASLRSYLALGQMRRPRIGSGG
jgi:hypothetical protein